MAAALLLSLLSSDLLLVLFGYQNASCTRARWRQLTVRKEKREKQQGKMADALQNLQTRDAFDEVNKAEGMGTGNKVHIRVQQRNRRKCILTIQGLDDDLDLKKICKALRKNLQCNGAVVKDKEYGDIIQLQGDHRAVVQEFLVDQEIITKDQLVVHGF